MYFRSLKCQNQGQKRKISGKEYHNAKVSLCVPNVVWHFDDFNGRS
jgi:hypothetical protein